jgi:GntR family transcriptional regulator, transcriptional repressor for pyruvate dehydrogenase complex
VTDNDQVANMLAEDFSAIPRESVVSSVARRLLDQLTSGRMAPGARLPSERELANSLQVGRSAVRGALAVLDVLGIVNIRPGSGTYLSGNSSDMLPRTINWGLMLGQPRTYDLVEVRQHLEILSAYLAAERATDASVESIKGRVEEMREAVNDTSKFVDADVAFHLEVAQAAGNSVLSDILHSIRELLHVWVERTSQDKASSEASLEEHTAVYKAIASRDPQAAQAAMQAHMAIASERLRRSLAENGD